MKLLFIIPEYPPHSGGGIATFYRDTLFEIVAQGHQVHVLVGSAFTSKLPSYVKDGVRVDFLDTDLVNLNLHKFSHYRAIPELQRHLAAAWAAWEQVKGGDGYDLVEVTDWGMLFAPWIVSPDSPPTVVQLHGSIGQIDFYDPQIDSQLQGNYVRLLEAGLLSSADELQANSQSNTKVWKLLTNRDVNYIPPALVSEDLMQLPSESSSSTNGLVVGRIQYWKGVTVLCEALRLLGEKSPNIDWIGRDTAYRDVKSSMSDYLKEHYSEIWQNKIIPLGTFPPNTTRQYQSQAKFILVPSIWDVFNYTCVEGMAQGKVVLCSEGAGVSDLIVHGQNGLTCLANNAEDLADKLEQMLSFNHKQRQEIGQAAKETVCNQLAPARIAQKRIERYQNLIQK
ncbi:MAG: glycosyltransferase family 4 protein, partial [Alphaproteobacteria bacterium]